MDKELMKTLEQFDDEVILQSNPNNGIVTGTINQIPVKCVAKYSAVQETLASPVRMEMDNKKVEITNQGVKLSQETTDTYSELSACDYSIGYLDRQYATGVYKSETVLPFLTCEKEDGKKIARTLLLTSMDKSYKVDASGTMALLLATNDIFDILQKKGSIDAEIVDAVNTHGFVYTKGLSSIDVSQNKMGDTYDKAVGGKTALSVCSVYKDKSDFTHGRKPSIMEVTVYHTTENGVKEPSRKMIYTLGKDGKYINAGLTNEYDDTYFMPEDVTFSPISYDVLITYLEELGLSLEPTEEFKTFAQSELVDEHSKRKNNITQIVNVMTLTKYRENAMLEDKKFEEKLTPSKKR